MSAKESIIKWYSTVIDCYFRIPVCIDFIILIILWILSTHTADSGMLHIIIFKRPDALTYLAYIVSGDITLAGFIIAALTILITVKSNTTARGYRDAKNALEYLFSTEHYYPIVRVFTGAIIQLFMFFIILYGAWLLQGNLEDKTIYRVLLFSTLGIVSAVFRVLYTLFKVLKLERLERT